MAEMTLVLKTLSNMVMDCAFPSDMTAREVADDIANQLNYPIIDLETSEPITFYLVDSNGNPIEDNIKLGAAGLRNGDIITIQATKPFITPPNPLRQTVPDPDGQLSLWIKLLNHKECVFEHFNQYTRVCDLLTQMLAKYNLPAHYPSSNDPIVYAVISETKGRQLHHSETLYEAGISDLDTLVILTDNKAGGGATLTRQVSLRPVGLRLDNITEIEIPALLSNEPALKMALHAFKDTLSQLEDSRQELQEAKGKIEQLTDRLKGNNIATALFLIGQIQIGFGTNLITNSSKGGWFVFLAGLTLNLAALYFSLFGVRKPTKM